MSSGSFWLLFWLLLLLPIVLVVLGKRESVRRAALVPEQEQDGLHFARRFAAASSILPVILLLLGSTHLAALHSSVTLLTLYIPIVGTLAGLCALVLYLLNGRGMERWIGTFASILAVAWLVLLVIAGWAAA